MVGGSHLTGAAVTIPGSPIGRPGRMIGPIPSSGQEMSGQGHRTFVEALAQFAAGAADGRVRAIAERATAPLRVVVRGRRGVGRRTVAGALGQFGTASGLLVTTPGQGRRRRRLCRRRGAQTRRHRSHRRRAKSGVGGAQQGRSGRLAVRPGRGRADRGRAPALRADCPHSPQYPWCR